MSTQNLGTAVAQWLRCYATNRKVAGLIPAGVSEFFIDIKSFWLHYGPGVDSTSNRNVPGVFPGGKGGRCVRLTTYQHPMPLSRNLGTLTSWNPLGLSRSVMGLPYVFFYHANFTNLPLSRQNKFTQLPYRELKLISLKLPRGILFQ
jgi:hypothetical protein